MSPDGKFDAKSSCDQRGVIAVASQVRSSALTSVLHHITGTAKCRSVDSRALQDSGASAGDEGD